MRAFPAFLLLVVLTACSAPEAPKAPPAERDWEETFEGHVIAMDGAPVGQAFRIVFFSTDEDAAPERYAIRSECMDFGYFDEDRQRFLSGHSPIGQGADKLTERARRDMTENHRRRCPADTPAVYNRLLDLMFEGATLTFEDDRGRLQSPSGRSAELVRVHEPIIID